MRRLACVRFLSGFRTTGLVVELRRRASFFSIRGLKWLRSEIGFAGDRYGGAGWMVMMMIIMKVIDRLARFRWFVVNNQKREWTCATMITIHINSAEDNRKPLKSEKICRVWSSKSKMPRLGSGFGVIWEFGGNWPTMIGIKWFFEGALSSIKLDINWASPWTDEWRDDRTCHFDHNYDKARNL